MHRNDICYQKLIIIIDNRLSEIKNNENRKKKKSFNFLDVNCRVMLPNASDK